MMLRKLCRDKTVDRIARCLMRDPRGGNRRPLDGLEGPMVGRVLFRRLRGEARGDTN